MVVFLSHLSIDSRNAYAQAEWWKPVLSYTDVPDDPNEPGHSECMITDPSGKGPDILFIEVPEHKAGKNRLHFDFRPSDDPQHDEVSALLDHGAVVVHDLRGLYGPDTGWVTLADPEGNEFCVLKSPAEVGSYQEAHPDGPGQERIVQTSRDIAAPAAVIFELIADPARQPEWDGNDNLAEAPTGQRVRAVGDVFRTTLTKGAVRENHVVAFSEDRTIAWKPAPEGGARPGHLWRWDLMPTDDGRTTVTHTYDWLGLDPQDSGRIDRAMSTTPENLRASLDRLAALAERTADA